MKRFLWLAFCVAISLVLIAGCGSNSDLTETADWKPTIYETVNNLEGVTMRVKERTVASTGLSIIFENTSDKQYTYGEPFLLEKNIKGNWHQVPIILTDNYGFNDIGYDLAASDISEWTVDWVWLYGNLETGQFRIIKDVLDVKEPGDYDTYHLVAEFIIA